MCSVNQAIDTTLGKVPWTGGRRGFCILAFKGVDSKEASWHEPNNERVGTILGHSDPESPWPTPAHPPAIRKIELRTRILLQLHCAALVCILRCKSMRGAARACAIVALTPWRNAPACTVRRCDTLHAIRHTTLRYASNINRDCSSSNSDKNA